MKTKEELLKFYGVEIGGSYIVTKVKDQKDKNLIGKIFIVRPWCKTDTFEVSFYEIGGHFAYPILNDLEYKLSVLDASERRYLKNVIKPFKNRVSVIIKYQSKTLNMEWLQICITDEIIGTTTTKESFSLPNFKAGTMYLGMKADKRYTLEELDLL